MNTAILQQQLQRTMAECEVHRKRLARAHGKIAALFPASAETLQTLDDAQVDTLDAYLYRFTKLQDVMGQRLFPQTLDLLAENTRGMVLIDQLNRLEQLGALPSAQQWLELRQLRNTLAHEYSDDKDRLAEGINTAFASLQVIDRIYVQIAQYVSRYDSNTQSRPLGAE